MPTGKREVGGGGGSNKEEREREREKKRERKSERGKEGSYFYPGTFPCCGPHVKAAAAKRPQVDTRKQLQPSRDLAEVLPLEEVFLAWR